MHIDITNRYNDGRDRLLDFRSRYTKSEYPSKIVLNIFYRQYTMDHIWESQIKNSFSQLKNSESQIMPALQKLEDAYSVASEQFLVGNTMTDLMNRQEDIGGLNYSNNIPLIERSLQGDETAIEELEFTYLYYYLSNLAVLLWAAHGRNGYSIIDAIAHVTGVIVKLDGNLTYADILSILGRLGVSRMMATTYRPLPVFHKAPLY